MTSALKTRQMPLAPGGVGDGQSPGSEVPRQCLMTQHPMPSPFHAAWLLSMEGQGMGLRELQGQEPRSSAQQGQDGKVGSWTAEDSVRPSPILAQASCPWVLATCRTPWTGVRTLPQGVPLTTHCLLHNPLNVWL